MLERVERKVLGKDDLFTTKEVLMFMRWVGEREDSLTYFLKVRGLRDMKPWVELSYKKHASPHSRLAHLKDEVTSSKKE